MIPSLLLLKSYFEWYNYDFKYIDSSFYKYKNCVFGRDCINQH